MLAYFSVQSRLKLDKTDAHASWSIVPHHIEHRFSSIISTMPPKGFFLRAQRVEVQNQEDMPPNPLYSKMVEAKGISVWNFNLFVIYDRMKS